MAEEKMSKAGEAIIKIFEDKWDEEGLSESERTIRVQRGTIVLMERRLAALERERDGLRELLTHAASTMQENTVCCSRCEAIRDALRSEKAP